MNSFSGGLTAERAAVDVQRPGKAKQRCCAISRRVKIERANNPSHVGKALMRNSYVKKGVEKIRSKVSDERALISQLNGTISDPNLKLLLRPTSRLLNDVENYFLDARVLERKEARTATALVHWLHEADKLLQLAIQQRKSFELIVKKFGPNARLISG
jgi:hypothetical protein